MRHSACVTCTWWPKIRSSANRNRARQIAAGTAQSVEAVLLQQLQEAFVAPLPALPPDEQRELEALTSLSDEALWTLAREQMAPDKQERMHTG